MTANIRLGAMKIFLSSGGRTLLPLCALRALKTCSVSCFVGSAMVLSWFLMKPIFDVVATDYGAIDG